MESFPKPKIIRSHRKTYSIQILPDATLVVKAPFFTPMFFINKFIQKNKSWIENKITKIHEQGISGFKTYNEGDVFFYMGRGYKLSIGNYSAIQLSNDKLLFPSVSKFRIKKELSNWYIKQAKEIITTQVFTYSHEMKAQFTDLKFSDTKSQWGRCTHDNRLQFSWRLIMAPLLVINYVVVHELAHTFYKNHSRTFWNKVRLYNPSYKQQIKWLKENGHSLKD